MTRSFRSKRTILAILIVANLAILGYLGLRNLSLASRATEIPLEVEALPSVEAIDDGGTVRRFSDLLGKPVVVQFVNPQGVNQIEAFSTVLRNFSPTEMSFVLITQDSRELRSKLPQLSQNTWVIEKGYDQLKQTFHIPECCEKRFIFNDQGTLAYDDYYYESDLTSRLNTLIKKDLPPWSDALMKDLAVLRNTQLSSVLENSRKPASQTAVVVLFSSVSTACSSGELVKMINSRIRQGSKISFLTLLPNNYSDIDLANFKANLAVNFAVERGNKEFSDRFANLVSVYGESRMNGTILLVENGQITILNSADELSLKLSRV